jgi:hypothetical protein
MMCILRRTTSTVAVVIFTVLLPIAGHPQGATSPRDIAGWGKTSWGMTESEVLTVLPGEAIRLAKPDKFDSGEALIGIEDFELAGGRFSVRFVFDTVNRRLNAVNLQLRESNTLIAERAFHTLEKALTEKYGLASYRNEDRKRGALGLTIDNKASWRLSKTMIELKFLYLEGVSHVLVLHYEPVAAHKELDEKL